MKHVRIRLVVPALVIAVLAATASLPRTASGACAGATSAATSASPGVPASPVPAPAGATGDRGVPAQAPGVALPSFFQFRVGPDAPATGRLGTLRNAAVSPDGTIYAVAAGASRPAVYRFGGRGELINAWGDLGEDPGQIGAGGPADVAVGPDRTVYVTDPRNNRVLRYTAWGAWLGEWGRSGRGAGAFDNSCDIYCVGAVPGCSAGGIGVAPDGTVYVSDNCVGRVQRFSPTGNYLGEWPATAPHDIAVGADGRVYVIEYVGHIAVFDSTGTRLGEIGRPGDGAGEFGICKVYNECGVAYTYPCGPESIAVGPDDTLLVADRQNKRIHRFTTDGAYVGELRAATGASAVGTPVSVAVAADGTVYEGEAAGGLRVLGRDGTFIGQWYDSGPARLPFDSPVGLAAVPGGGVYVSDRGNRRVIRLDAGGNVVGVLRGPVEARIATPAGVAVASDGSVWVADSGNARLLHFDAGGAYAGALGHWGGGPGELSTPAGVAVGPGDRLYVGDSGNRRVACFAADGTVCGELPGSRAPGLVLAPAGVAVGPDGTVYVADAKLGVVVFDPEGAPAPAWRAWSTTGRIDQPGGIAVAADGTVWVTDAGAGSRVAHLSRSGEFLGTLGGAGCADRQLLEPQGIVALADGSIVVADTGNGRLVRIAADGTADPTWSARSAPDARFRSPTALDVAADGTTYVLDADNHHVVRLSARGEVIAAFGRTGCAGDGIGDAVALSVAPWGDVLVLDGAHGRIVRFGMDGALLGDVPTIRNVVGSPRAPMGLAAAVEPDGRRVVLVARSDSPNLYKYRLDGTLVATIASNAYPAALAVAPDGSLYVADTRNDRVIHQASDGREIAQLSPGWRSWRARDITVAQDGTVYVAANGRVHAFTASGDYAGVWPSSPGAPGGQPVAPTGVAVAPDGSVWVADQGAHRVVAYGPAPVTYWHTRFHADAGHLDGPVATETTPAVRYDWGLLAPAPGVPADGFSARIEHLSDWPTGVYMLRLTVSGGATLEAGRHAAIVASGHPATTVAAVELRRGRDLLRIDYSDTGGTAAVRLEVVSAAATVYLPFAGAHR